MIMDEEAKAAQEIAKTSGKAIDAVRDAGGFMAKFIAGPLGTASEMINDRLKYMRWERQQRLMMKAQQLLLQSGLEEPTQRIPLSVAVPLLEAATLEEDDELQDIWASLLVNASNINSNVQIKRMYITILQDMGNLEVKCLEKIVNYTKENIDKGYYVATAGLPSAVEPEISEIIPPVPTGNVALAIRNLVRLGCVDPIMTMGGMSIRSVMPTEVGTALVEACTINKNS